MCNIKFGDFSFKAFDHFSIGFPGTCNTFGWGLEQILYDRRHLEVMLLQKRLFLPSF
jgi:hypothetical protein